jgi:nucleoside-diphosphate-sugar epimerase
MRSMRVLLTGSTGFLGSYVAEELVARGHEVTALVRPASDHWRLADVRFLLHKIEGDMNAVRLLQPKLCELNIEAVIHLAWQGVRNSEHNSPRQAANVAATVEIAELAAGIGASVFIGSGSQAEYGPYDRAIREDDAPRPTTLYGEAKLAAGGKAARIAAAAGIRFAWLRVFSTYGPRDNDYWLVPSLIRELKSGRRMKLTACEQHWGFLHARDAAAGYRTVLEAPSASGVFNLGSADAPPLRETVTKLRDMVDPSGELGFGDIPYRPDQIMVLAADTTRLESLGWRPAVDLADGLRETVAWMSQSKPPRRLRDCETERAPPNI